MIGMNILPRDTRILVLRCLVEGMSLRSTSRTAGVIRGAVAKLLVDAGKACADFQDKMLRDLPCERIQCDEIWSFVYAKEKNVLRAKSAPPEAGDVWTWTAICADTKLILSWRLGDRSGDTAADFIADLRSRLAKRAQLTTDGHRAYLDAVEKAFGADVDYAMLVKIYGKGDPERTSEGALQPVRVHRNPHPGHRGEAGRKARQHVVCGASEPHDADEHAAIHQADQRFQQALGILGALHMPCTSCITTSAVFTRRCA